MQIHASFKWFPNPSMVFMGALKANVLNPYIVSLWPWANGCQKWHQMYLRGPLLVWVSGYHAKLLFPHVDPFWYGWLATMQNFLHVPCCLTVWIVKRTPTKVGSHFDKRLLFMKGWNQLEGIHGRDACPHERFTQLVTLARVDCSIPGDSAPLLLTCKMIRTLASCNGSHLEYV